MPAQPIYQFYAELTDYEPKIWRRFQVLNNITVARLGYILMTMFEMKASHLFCIDVPFEENFRVYMQGLHPDEDISNILSASTNISIMRYELIDEDAQDDPPPNGVKMLEASQRKVKDAVGHPGERMFFTYDYGDNWQVSLMLEECIADKELSGKLFPRVLQGEGYGIIEDCGGTPGLEELARAFKKKKGVAYKDFCKWLDVDDLDLQAFDLDDMNFRVKKVPRIYADIYERMLSPTQQSINLLERRGKYYGG